MDPNATRRKSQGVPSSSSNSKPAAPVPQGSSTTTLPGSVGMRNSVSRPDSFLPLVPSMSQESTAAALFGSAKSTAASSGSDISKDHLIQLLGAVEDEYDKVVKENARLKAQIESMSRSAVDIYPGSSFPPSQLSSRAMMSSKYHHQTVPMDDPHSPPHVSSVDTSLQKLKILKEEQLQKFKTTSRRKIASATSRLRNIPTAEAVLVRSYAKHNDGIWDVAAPKHSMCPYRIFGAASADAKASICNAKTGHNLMQYQGHDGSVNSLRFQPVRVSMGDSVLCLTASGDCTAHIWKVSSAQLADKESDDERAVADGEVAHAAVKPPKMLVNYPLMVLRSHTNAVSCADWISGADHVITASWDRSAIVFDVETGDNLNTFAGHDDELTYVAVCRPQKLFVTCSKDTTFRLWDLREPNLQSVSVFQGHAEAVNCAVFTPGGDSIVSGGDDKILRVWDMRNMRAPKTSVRMEDGINRLSISDSLVVAVPLDNRSVGLYSMTTGKLSRLPRAKRQGHQRIVTACSWADDVVSASPPSGAADVNLFTCGFDRQVLGWKVGPL